MGVVLAACAAIAVLPISPETIRISISDAFLGVVMGLLISGFMVPSTSVKHDIHWDEVKLAGPSKLFGPSLGKTRTVLLWRDIVSEGTVATGYHFVATASDDRIYYSPYSNGLKPFKLQVSSVLGG